MALFTLSPIFGRRNMVTFAKIALGILITYILLPITPHTYDVATANIVTFALVVLKEVMLGLVIGYITTVFFNAPLIAGQVIDMQIGFGMVQIFDPFSNTNVAMTGTILNMIMLITFMILDGHLILIQILADSFVTIPAGTLIYEPGVYARIVEIFLYMLVLAVKISLPITGIMAVAEMSLGIIVRSVPQMNVFVIGVPLKIALGVLAMFMVLPIYITFTDGIFRDMFNAITVVFSEINAAP